jgi:hypothetical protein
MSLFAKKSTNSLPFTLSQSEAMILAEKAQQLH